MLKRNHYLITISHLHALLQFAVPSSSAAMGEPTKPRKSAAAAPARSDTQETLAPLTNEEYRQVQEAMEGHDINQR